MAEKCGFVGDGARSDIKVNYDLTLQVKIVVFTISPTFSSSTSFACGCRPARTQIARARHALILFADDAFAFDDNRPALAARHIGTARGRRHLWPYRRQLELSPAHACMQYMYNST